MTDSSLNASPLLSPLPSTSPPGPKYTAESLVSLIRDGHPAKLSFPAKQGIGASSTTSAAAQCSTIQSATQKPPISPNDSAQKNDADNAGFNEKDLSRSPVAGTTFTTSIPVGSASSSVQVRNSGSPSGAVNCRGSATPSPDDSSQHELLPQRQKCTQQSAPTASVSMYLTSSDLRNLQNFRLLAERDGFLVDQSPKLAVSIEDVRRLQSNRWSREKERKLFTTAANAVVNASPKNERPSANVKVLNSSIPVLAGTAFTIKNENHLEQFDDRRTVNSTATGTTTEDEDDPSLSSLGRVSRHDQEESNKSASLSISGLSGKFLIPAQLQFSGDSSNIGLPTSSVAAAAFSSLAQNNTANQQSQNHFPKSSTTSANTSRVLTSNSPATLLCNSDGQLIVPADQINILKAFGELHGYKIQTASGGQGLVLSASNQEQTNGGNVALPLIKNQSQIPNFTTLLPMHQLAQDAARKREMRLQKNREAARECRRKKKEYIRCLENRVAVLENQNKALLDDLRQLRELYCQSAAAAQSQQQSGQSNVSTPDNNLQQSQQPPTN